MAAACSAPPPQLPDAPDHPGDSERYYAIWLGGAQIGTAHETEQWSHAQLTVQRTESMRFLRGDVPIALSTAIQITADAQLVPSHVAWTETGQVVRHGEAARDATGWLVTSDTGSRRLPSAAVPAELVPMIVRRDGHFAGDVFLPARGFVAGPGRIDPVAPGRLVARLSLDAGAAAATAEATIDLGSDAMPVRVVDGEGVIATRITAAEAAAPFVPVDLIAATSIPLTGSPSPAAAAGDPSADRTHRLALELDDTLALPPLPGQSAQPSTDGLTVELSAKLRGRLPPGPAGPDRSRDIITLVVAVRHRIVPDLAATPTSASAAAAAGTGDCTTFALAYAALAAGRGIPTRVVTGFRIDGDRLIRHRWAISWTGRTWIAVDAAFGAVPAGGDLLGLAVHDADDVGLVAGDAALTHLRAARWR